MAHEVETFGEEEIPFWDKATHIASDDDSMIPRTISLLVASAGRYPSKPPFSSQ